jgi:Pyruvate/2-oxoacid:ferredoxin oxidoreductase delta subunit
MSSDAILWGVSVALVVAIVLPYALSFRRRRHADRARKEEAARLGFDRPTAQYPFVDAGLCVGCGSCVKACPEGDVLGIVGGVATVVNGLRCVGHARCEMACPVRAIQVGLGDVKSREDVPIMDDWYETTVPGVFVAGELTGMALVKNAVRHGTRVVERIAERAGRDGAHGRPPPGSPPPPSPASVGSPPSSSSRRPISGAPSSTTPAASWPSSRRWTFPTWAGCRRASTPRSSCSRCSRISPGERASTSASGRRWWT